MCNILILQTFAIRRAEKEKSSFQQSFYSNLSEFL